MKMRTAVRALSTIVALLMLGIEGRAQSVDVSVSLDETNILYGHTTTLRVHASIKPALASEAEQIFSWYVDLLNTNSAVASISASQLVMSASDNTPPTTSSGTVQAASIRAIYNTFLNLPNAGRLASVELLAVPVVALQTGSVTFAVQPGSTALLAHDFIVATTNGPVYGGDYALATAVLHVRELAPFPIACAVVTNGVRVTFTPVPGAEYTVQTTTNPMAEAWATLPGAPHNSGLVVDTNSGVKLRWYRVLGD